MVPNCLWKILSLSIFLFCFSIYAWVLGGPYWLVHLTPLGGIGFVFFWLSLIWLTWRNRTFHARFEWWKNFSFYFYGWFQLLPHIGWVLAILWSPLNRTIHQGLRICRPTWLTPKFQHGLFPSLNLSYPRKFFLKMMRIMTTGECCPAKRPF